MKLKSLIFLAFLMPLLAFSQMKFKSIGTAKPIEFTFGFQHQKGAFVWYKGKSEPIPLKLKSLDIDSSERESGQPNFYTYKYTEIYNGKATGEYGITEWPRNVADIYYIRYKDGKKIKFSLVEDDEFYDGKSMVLVKDVQFNFYSFYKDSLIITYPEGNKVKYNLNPLDEDRARRVQIKDYNFDGIDDVSFDITSGDGLNVAYDVFIYNPGTKKFNKVEEPANLGCGGMVNLKIDKVNKQLITMCKSGPKWYTFIYKFNKMGQLVLVKKE